MTGSTNGTAKAIENLENGQKDLFDRVHDLETKGCPFRDYHEKEVDEVNEELKLMERKLDRLTIELYKAVAVATAVISAVTLVTRFI